MPLNETPNTITVGHICLSCALLHTKQCPFKNHLRTQVTQFQGDIRGKCTHYMSLTEANGDRDMVKEAKVIREAELNVELYKKIYALDDKQRNKLFSYWSYLFPQKYAEDMVTDENESKQKNLGKPNRKDKKKDKIS